MAKANQIEPQGQIPFLPDYLPISGRKNELLPWSWAEKTLQQSKKFWISTVSRDSKSNLVPIWGIWIKNCFYFCAGRRSRKVLNLKQNSSCVIATEDPDSPVIVEGDGEEVSNVKTIEYILQLYIDKYKLPFKASELGITDDQGNSAPLFRVKPIKVMAWERFPSNATKWLL